MKPLNVGIFNDSFPPVLDGVANTAVNYAKEIQAHYGNAVVATPWYPDVADAYDFKVIRYYSANVSERLGYRIGNPFNPMLIRKLEKERLDILHIHSPFTSAMLARMLRQYMGIPIVFTYHTKFDQDIEKRVALESIRAATVKLILNNINACDAVWAVSEGAGENLQSLGYKGAYDLMENGTDFVKGRASDADIQALEAEWNILPEETVFLFVGRMMWYKNIRFILDGLKATRDKGVSFKMMFVGEGVDRKDIMDYAEALGLSDCCIFTGAIYDREYLRVFFSRAQLFVFPSTYDTNGIVVKEAAACSCPSLLIEASCAAEGIFHGDTGILSREAVADFSDALVYAAAHPQWTQAIGERAAEKLYMSWRDAVGRAYSAYYEIIERHKKKHL